MRLVLLFAILFLPLQAWAQDAPPAKSQGETSAYLEELIDKARGKKLWENRTWHLLMHYNPGTFYGYESEADGDGFFHASDGKTNPQAELEASLAGFFSTETRSPGKMTSQCAFPARYHWMKEQLEFDPKHLPEQTCNRFDEWFDALNPASVSLVFSSHYLNNPGSMFGHTLLVLNHKDRPHNERLLNFVINYAAAIPDDVGGLQYTLGGLFGGFNGLFSIVPYYLKVREYNDMESRDMWEYELNFSRPQLKQMVRHAWELFNTHFDYFFLKENCSYHLLSLLEIADPRLHLREDYLFWALPTDTVRSVAKYKGLVKRVTYRPSRSSQIIQKFALLSGPEGDIVHKLRKNPEALNDSDFLALPPSRRALVLDTAIDFWQYRIADEGGGNSPHRKPLRKLLIQRSKITEKPPEVPNTPTSSPPDKGHYTSRFSLGGGQLGLTTLPEKPMRFHEFNYQPSFHPLMSKEDGYAENSAINLGQLRLRYFPDLKRTQVERFIVAQAVSLFPLSPALKKPSWHFTLGWDRNKDGACDGCVPFITRMGAGYAAKTHGLSKEIYFAFANLETEWQKKFDLGYRVGLGANMGVIVDIVPSWRIMLEGEAVRFFAGEKSERVKVNFKQRINLGDQTEIRLDLSRVNKYREFRLTLARYFWRG